MRATSFILFLAAFALMIPTVPYCFPGYNDGNGIPVSDEGQSFITMIGAWQISALTPQFNYFGGSDPSALDYIRMSVQIIWIAIIGFITICSVILFAYPIITTVFPIPPVAGALIQLVIYVAVVIAAAQVYRGVSWGLNE